GYRLRRNAALPDVRELWRRQSFHLDEEPLEDGVYERLHDRVIAFQVRYFDEVDEQAEERTEWDAAVRHRLPALVRIDLTLEAVPRTTEDLGRRDSAGRALHYRRVIALDKDSELRLRCHAVVPTFVAAGGGTTGGANQGDGGEDEDGGPDGGNGPGKPSTGPEGGGPDSGGTGGTPSDSFDDALNDLLGGG
ncbi:MAG TPA: hypothetical protein VFD43_00715, partial [Planctomycetota bacterium]|nr:hypothetical protein [Planctomycetota bacterium]